MEEDDEGNDFPRADPTGEHRRGATAAAIQMRNARGERKRGWVGGKKKGKSTLPSWSSHFKSLPRRPGSTGLAVGSTDPLDLHRLFLERTSTRIDCLVYGI